MDDIAKWVSNNPWMIILSFVIGIIGVVFTPIFYFKSKKTKILKYKISTHNLIKDSVSRLEGLDIKYNSKIIKNFSVSQVTLWNAGTDTIDGDDIADADPLKIVVDGSEDMILGQPEIVCNNNASGFSYTLSDDCREISINFDYMDKGYGCAIILYHTSKCNNALKIKGSIKGGNIHETELLNLNNKRRIVINSWIFLSYEILILLFLAYEFETKISRIALALVGSLFGIASLLISIPGINKIRKEKNVPKTLKSEILENE